MKKTIFLLLSLILLPSLLWAGGKESGVNWLPIERALKEAKEEKKPVLIDFYAQWCGYCKKMKRETYTDKRVIEKINGLFKAVSVDIEGKNKVVVDGKSITESQFSDGFNVTSTPTTWFLKPNGDLIKGIPGYMEPDEFIDILGYVGEGWYEKMGIMEYLNKKPRK